MIIVGLLLFLFAFKLSLCELTYNDDATCSVTSIYSTCIVYHNSVTYFRSPNFPATMFNSTLIDQNSLFCNAKFDTETANSKLWFVIFNGMTGTFNVFNDYSDDVTQRSFGEDDYFTFAPSYFPITFQFIQNSSNYPSEWVAFEGIVYAYTPMNLCPFSEETINLESNRVIPISSSYDLNDNSGNNCKWTFTINSNQTLKIVFKYLRISNAILQLETEKYPAIIFESNVDPQNPTVSYYGSESGIFTLSYDINDTNIYTSFFALVSAVDRNPKNPKQICKSNSTGLFTDISNLDYNLGYSALDSCQYQILIPQNYEIILNPYCLMIEKNADILALHYPTVKPPVNLDTTYYLTSDANGTILEFSADGNTQQVGFTVQQRMLDCQCASSNIIIIPCNGESKITALSGTNNYCSNIACNFTISLDKTCNLTYFSLAFEFQLRSNDFMLLSTNGRINDNFTFSSPQKFQRIFTKNTTVTLQFSSGEAPSPISADSHNWLIYYDNSTIPNILPTIHLTEALPYHLLQVGHISYNDAFVICSPVNDTLELFISDVSSGILESYTLYDSDNMDNFIGDLNSPFISTSDDRFPRHIISSSGCFSVYMGVLPANIYLFFRMQKAHSKNCKNTNNVFSINRNDNTSIFGSANENGDCEITLLAPVTGYLPVIKFENIKPSSNDSFKVSSIINQKTYFVTNSNDSNEWKGATVYAQALSITIPPSQNINVTIKLHSQKDENIYLTDSGKNGIFASPSYGGYTSEYQNSELLNTRRYDYNTYNIELNVKSMDGNGTAFFYNRDESKNITILPHQIISQNGTYFVLTYQNFNNFTFLIEYTVTVIIPPTTTSTTTTTTTPLPTTTPQILSTNFTLNYENSYYVFWLDNIPNDGYLSVCCSDYDGRLELFVTSGYHLDFYELYNFNGLYHPVGSLKNLSTSNVLWPSSIVATFSNCFTIVKTQETEQSLATLFFRRIDQSGGVNNVFQVPTISSPAINISNYNGYPSEVFFLASLSALPIIRVGSITSAYLNSYSFKSAINQKPLLSFNSNDTSNWRNIAIYTNALSLTFTADISIVFFNDNTLIMKDEQINQRGIMVSPSYTGFSTKLNGSKMLYQFSDNENITNKIRAVFGVKTLDENCTVYVENNQNNHTFTQNETYITTGNQINIFYEETTTQTDGFMIEYNLTSASKITILDGTAPTHVYWLDDLKNNETITVCSPDDSDTLQMFVTKEKYNGDLNLYYLYDSNQIDNCIGSLELITTNYRNTPNQIPSASGCFTVQNTNTFYNSLTSVTLLFRLKKTHSENCIGPNVFEVQLYQTTISSSASSNGSCEIIILSSKLQEPAIPINSFQNMYPGSITLRSGINQKTLVTIDTNNTDLWKSFKIYTPALSIVVSSYFNLQLDASDKTVDNWISNGFVGQKGIIAAPAFNGFFSADYGTLFSFNPNSCQTDSETCGINFEVNSTDYQSVKYTVNNGVENFFEQSNNITLFGTSVDVSYAKTPSNSSFFISYTIVKPAEPSTSGSPAISLFPTITTLLLFFIITPV